MNQLNVFNRIPRDRLLSTMLKVKKIHDLIPPRQGATVLIHIGKTGGTTVTKGLRFAVRNKRCRIYHLVKPVFRKDLKYIICSRDPIARVVSAFNWRKEIIIEQGLQRRRFQGEVEALKDYININELAEALYSQSGEPNEMALSHFRTIHHLDNGIAFHLKDFLGVCKKEQIVDVLMQETLEIDVLRCFGYQINASYNQNTVKIKSLSKLAMRNLGWRLKDDYACHGVLSGWGYINSKYDQTPTL